MKTEDNHNKPDYLAHHDKITNRVQTLLEHSKNVAGLCKYYGNTIGCPNLAELCGYLHDMGKAKQEFQNYLTEKDENKRKSLRGKINHSSAGAKYIFEKYGNSSNSSEKYTAQIIALSISSHHSGLVDCITPNGEDNFKTRINPETEIQYSESRNGFEKRCLSSKEIENKFKKTVGEINTIKNEILSDSITPDEKLFYWSMFTRYLLSCVIDADRYDTFCFADNIPTKDKPEITSAKWNELLAELETALDKKIPEYEIDKLRKEISVSCKKFGQNKGGIYRLNVPTGGGKTFSSLRYALTHASQWNKKRIFYVIPFTTIIDQNAAVIRDVLCRNNTQNNELILEHHSNLILDKEENEEESGPTDSRNYHLLTERWDAPIILTTTVQMLNTLFLGTTSSVRRMHNLSDSVIIFDEVQAIPAKCLSMFNAAMNFLSKICNTTIIMCTATQPKFEEIKPSLEFTEPKDMVHVDFEKFKRTNIIDKSKHPEYSTLELKEFILNRFDKNNTILVILNTKTAVKKLYEQLNTEILSNFTSYSDYSLYYLTTNLCQAHRMGRLTEIRNKLDMNPKPRLICLSTQLIEAGVDISFDCVIRSCAGIDSISQAAGRCNRNGEVNSRDVFIVNFAEEKLGGLRDIKIGKDCAEHQLDDYKRSPDSFDNTILSPKMIEGYYTKYFTNRNNETQYNITKEMVKKKNISIIPTGTIYNLLSLNKNGLNAYTRDCRKIPYYLCQAFATAGKLFEVIDQDTVSVIVNYEEGSEIIEKLNGNISNSEKVRLLKRAQYYSVNIYGSSEQLLTKGAIMPIADTGAYTINSLYYRYDDEYGLVFQNEVTIY